MKNHYYKFGGVIRRQAQGGPIGLSLTGDVAQVVMAWWDREMIDKLEREGVEVLLYSRYVDDINTALRCSGSELHDAGLPNDETNMQLFQRLANTIHPSIQVTIDYPTNHHDAKLPSLDLKLWTEQRNNHTVIVHEHYCKDVASKAVINARSAVPWKNKRTILTQEILRILRNCSIDLPWERVSEHVTEFTARMQYSGYSQEFRAEVVKSALHAYDQMKARDNAGDEPMYRPREWRRVERAEARRDKRGSWFRGKESANETVVFIPATPNSELRRRYVEVINRSGVGIAVAEVPGTTLKQVLQKSDVEGGGCGEENCLTCKEGGGGKRCRREGVVYRIKCTECDDSYVGETAGNAYTRGLQHADALRRGHSSSALHAHSCNKHADAPTPPQYNMEVVAVYAGDATKRQIAEALLIEHTPSDQRINRKEEFTRCHVPRVVSWDSTQQSSRD